MCSLYTENADKWRHLASIDYLTNFIKAWIAFNAWYKNAYPNLNTDKQIIDEIKNNPNTFRDKIISLLRNNGEDGIIFRTKIYELHRRLENKYIYNKSKQITFKKIVIEENPTKQNSFVYFQLTYKVERNIPSRNKKEIDISITKSDGTKKFSYTQTNGFDISDLISHSHFSTLSSNQQTQLKVCYEKINPFMPVNLLLNDLESDDYIEMGSIKFISDTEKIAKALIEILYKLRNSLFHGEIVPNQETNQVYEPAYDILYTIIQYL